MRTIFFLIVLAVCGCSQLDVVEQTVTHELPSVVMASELHCDACAEQKRILDQMVQNRQVLLKVVDKNHPLYKTDILPALYICGEERCVKLVGLQSQENILKAAQ
jgi:hypothetical protein